MLLTELELSPTLAAARTSFLRQIRSDLDDRSVRLVYADWLEENLAEEPLTAPTCEFIRLSCVGGPEDRMPPAAYDWLRVNWRRLVPSILALHRPYPADMETIPVQGASGYARPWDGGPLIMRNKGREVFLRMYLDRPGHPRARRPYRGHVAVYLWFGRGFLWRYACGRLWANPIIQAALRRDQPHMTHVRVTS